MERVDVALPRMQSVDDEVTGVGRQLSEQLQSNSLAARTQALDNLHTALFTESSGLLPSHVRSTASVLALVRLLTTNPNKVLPVLEALLTQDFQSQDELDRLDRDQILQQLVMNLQVDSLFGPVSMLIVALFQAGFLTGMLGEVAAMLSTETLLDRYCQVFERLRRGPLDENARGASIADLVILHALSAREDNIRLLEQHGAVTFTSFVLSNLAQDEEMLMYTLNVAASMSMLTSISTLFVTNGTVVRAIELSESPHVHPGTLNSCLIIIHNAADSPVGSSLLLQYVPRLMRKMRSIDQTEDPSSVFLISGVLGNLCAHLPGEKILMLCRMGVIEHFQAMLATRDRELGYTSAIVALSLIAGARCSDPANLSMSIEDAFGVLGLDDEVFVQEMIECFDASIAKETFAEISFDPWLPAKVLGCLVLNPKFAVAICSSTAVDHCLECCHSENPRVQECAIQAMFNMRTHVRFDLLSEAHETIQMVCDSGSTQAARQTAERLLAFIALQEGPDGVELSSRGPLTVAQSAAGVVPLLALAFPLFALYAFRT
eukprot:m.565931 g.565931  ORF g.565931 m.565931 type:complete len:547 (-) comp57831_c0_seq3:142-1782(-)